MIANQLRTVLLSNIFFPPLKQRVGWKNAPLSLFSHLLFLPSLFLSRVEIIESTRVCKCPRVFFPLPSRHLETRVLYGKKRRGRDALWLWFYIEWICFREAFIFFQPILVLEASSDGQNHLLLCPIFFIVLLSNRKGENKRNRTEKCST